MNPSHTHTGLYTPVFFSLPQAKNSHKTLFWTADLAWLYSQTKRPFLFQIKDDFSELSHCKQSRCLCRMDIKTVPHNNNNLPPSDRLQDVSLGQTSPSSCFSVFSVEARAFSRGPESSKYPADILKYVFKLAVAQFQLFCEEMKLLTF